VSGSAASNKREISGVTAARVVVVAQLVKCRRKSRLETFRGEADVRMGAEGHDLHEADVATKLVRRIREGDSAAETELVQRYGPRLRYVLYRQMAAFPHDVDDVVQESLTTAVIRLRESGIEDPAKLGGFIYGIARNLRSAAIRDHARHDGNADPDLISRLPGREISPDQILASSETTRIVRQLLAELGNRSGTERDREVLVRLFIRQESRTEISEALGIEPDHLRRVIHRAKQRLKALLVESMNSNALGRMADD
jgi:RNA polymerase sigma-70 factor (ECF subfamily)